MLCKFSVTDSKFCPIFRNSAFYGDFRTFRLRSAFVKGLATPHCKMVYLQAVRRMLYNPRKEGVS